MEREQTIDDILTTSLEDAMEIVTDLKAEIERLQADVELLTNCVANFQKDMRDV